MRRYSDVERRSHRRDLGQLPDAAGVTDVGVDDVRRACLAHLSELVTSVESLASHHWDRRRLFDFLDSRNVVRRAGLLEPIWLQRLQLAGYSDRVHRGESAMHLDQQLHFRTNSLTNRSHHLDRLLQGATRRILGPRTRKWIELQSLETALRNQNCRTFAVLLRSIATRPTIGIKLQPRPHWAT